MTLNYPAMKLKLRKDIENMSKSKTAVNQVRPASSTATCVQTASNYKAVKRKSETTLSGKSAFQLPALVGNKVRLSKCTALVRNGFKISSSISLLRDDVNLISRDTNVRTDVKEKHPLLRSPISLLPFFIRRLNTQHNLYTAHYFISAPLRHDI